MHSIRGVQIVHGYLIPNITDPAPRSASGYKGSFTGASEPRASPSNLLKRGRPIDKLPAVGLRDPLRDGLSDRGQLRLPSLFALLKQPQSLAQHLALGLIVTGLEKLRDKLIEDWAQIDVHTVRLTPLTEVDNC
jgi:hypothetical protein